MFPENVLLYLYFLSEIFRVFYVLILGTIHCLFSMFLNMQFVISILFMLFFSTCYCPSLSSQDIYWQENSHSVRRQFSEKSQLPMKFSSSPKPGDISRSSVRRSQRALLYNYILYTYIRSQNALFYALPI